MPNKFKIPETIYLQCHDDDGELFDVDGEEVTWCEDDTDGHNIKYIRADAVLTNAMHSDGKDRGDIWTNEDESAEIERQIMEDACRLLIQDANAYLSGGGCGAVSVQNAAKLYRGMK